jgi:hypothetical protein
MKQRILLSVGLLLCLSSASHAQSPVTIRGRLDVVVQSAVVQSARPYPAHGARINLRSSRGDETRSLPVYAGADGMFYLSGVPSGSVFLLDIALPESSLPIWTCALFVPPSPSLTVLDLAPIRISPSSDLSSRRYDVVQINDGTQRRFPVDSVSTPQSARVARCAPYVR